MQEIFAALNHGVEGAPIIAGVAAFLWGVLSIILSPCHLASIPLIVGFIDKQGRIPTQRAFLISSLFAIGILITIAAVGLVTALAGRMAGDIGPYGNYGVAVIFFAVGLHLLDLLPLPWSGISNVGIRRKGLLAAFFLGLVFGVALGRAPSPTWRPCWLSPSGSAPEIFFMGCCLWRFTALGIARSSFLPEPSPRLCSNI